MERTFLLSATVLVWVCASGALQAAEMQEGRCGGVDNPAFLCGPVNAEDILRIPGTDWVLASRFTGFAGPGDAGGAIYLLDAQDHSWRSISIDAIPGKPDKTLYPDCPGKPASATFRGHGMTFGKRDSALTLFAINHAAQESIEVFDVGVKESGEPTLTWSGCIVAPAGALLNSVAVLPDGGLAATKFFDTGNKTWGPDLMAAKDTGNVLEWSPKNGWKEVDGTTMSGPNGILVSPDGSAYFVAEWGARKLHRISRGKTPPVRETIDTGMLTDNLHWDAGGRVLASGQWVEKMIEYSSCMQSKATVCAVPFKVLRIDPATLAVETVVSYSNSTEFGGGTTALDLGSEYWIGTSRGDRIARIVKQK